MAKSISSTTSTVNHVRGYHPRRLQERQGRSAHDILRLCEPGKTRPRVVLETLIQLFNHQHSAKQKDVSFKTRQERARFLRKFFRDLQQAGFKTLPDPRNLDQRHIRATVERWKQQELTPATLQSYFSFLRTFAQWIRKPGLVQSPSSYGLTSEQYRRQEGAQSDKSWSAHGIDAAEVIARISGFDPWIGAALLLIQAFGLRRKEALMFHPDQVVGFIETGLPDAKRTADRYLAVLRGSKGGRRRYIPVDSPAREAALLHALQHIRADGDLAPAGRTLKQALERFSYTMKKFGLTAQGLGATAHGLRHQVLLETFAHCAGYPAPVRGGVDKGNEDRDARQQVAELAGHGRHRASSAYLGSVRKQQDLFELDSKLPTKTVEK